MQLRLDVLRRLGLAQLLAELALGLLLPQERQRQRRLLLIGVLLFRHAERSGHQAFAMHDTVADEALGGVPNYYPFESLSVWQWEVRHLLTSLCRGLVEHGLELQRGEAHEAV